MYRMQTARSSRNKALLYVTASLAALACSSAFAQANAPTNPSVSDQQTETVVVTGYRASLEDSTVAKRNAVNFSDSVFAEAIGKFPDTNIAEALNRIPGVTIVRDVDDEGVNVQIRGLGTNFTKVLLNGANIAVATTGATDAQNNNREVDLNMFPTELFTKLTVSKSPTADQLEGGLAGTVDMRSARPFDNPGAHFSYNVQGTDYSLSQGPGLRGSAIASDTEGPFGILVGISAVQNNVFTKGWEDGNAGWVTPTINNATLCGNATGCDQSAATSIGGNSMSIPATVPNNVTTGGLIPGETVNAALLEALNPGVTTTQLANLLLPRLGRTMFEEGHRNRYNGIFSFEYRPTAGLHFYFDSIYGREDNDLNRSDLNWGVRAGAGSQPMIPENVIIDPTSLGALNGLGGVIQSGTFANAQFLLEARPYVEKGEFFSMNPGMDWQLADTLHFDLQGNWTRSRFLRDSPTVFVVTCPSAGNPTGVPGCTAPVGGVVANVENLPGMPFPSITSNINLDDPANFQWNNGRVNLQDEKRLTYTDGFRGEFTWGGDDIALKTGFAFDDAFRNITAIDASQIWQNAACGNNPNVYMPPASYSGTGGTISNSQPPCQGLASATPNPVPGGYPTWPGLGTGSTTGAGPLVWQGSGIPQSSLYKYLIPGPTGFITANYPAIEAASNYNAIDKAAQGVCGMPHCTPTYPFSTASNTGATSGNFDEKTWGLFGQLDGVVNLDRDLKYNLGLRWIETRQTVWSPEQVTDPRNISQNTQNGGVYPAYFDFVPQSTVYHAWLPSMNLVYEMTDDFQLRASASRTITRAFPGQMIGVVNFSDLTAQNATLGNPFLKPYFSNNYEFGANYFTGGEGYVGIDIFKKYVTGFPVTENVTEPFGYLAQFGITYDTLVTTQQQALQARWGCSSQATCATAATILVSEPENVSGILSIDGVEFNWVQPLDFLTDRYLGLQGFGWTANVTVLDTSSSGSAPIHPGGVASLTYNVTGYYENNGYMMRFQYNWVDKSYQTGSTNNQGVCLPNSSFSTGTFNQCPQGAYIFNAARGELDMSASVKLSKFFQELPSDPELIFEIQNLNDAPLVTYNQFPNAVHSYYDPGRVFFFGMRGTF